MSAHLSALAEDLEEAARGQKKLWQFTDDSPTSQKIKGHCKEAFVLISSLQCREAWTKENTRANYNSRWRYSCKASDGIGTFWYCLMGNSFYTKLIVIANEGLNGKSFLERSFESTYKSEKWDERWCPDISIRMQSHFRSPTDGLKTVGILVTQQIKSKPFTVPDMQPSFSSQSLTGCMQSIHSMLFAIFHHLIKPNSLILDHKLGQTSLRTKFQFSGAIRKLLPKCCVQGQEEVYNTDWHWILSWRQQYDM